MAQFSLPPSGKWYYEVHIDSVQSGGAIYYGWSTDTSLGVDEYAITKGIFFSSYNEQVLLDGSGQSGGYGSNGTDQGSNGDIYSILLDVDNGRFYYAKNGTYFNSADPAAGTGGLDVSATLVGESLGSLHAFQEVVHTTKLIQLILVKIVKMYRLQIQMKMVLARLSILSQIMFIYLFRLIYQTQQ